MLTIRAVSFKGRPLDRELAARFEEAGGTIGRGETNTLVLSDPERFISRTHATISFQAGGYLITDTGTKNPVVVNGRAAGLGQPGAPRRRGSGQDRRLRPPDRRDGAQRAAKRPVEPAACLAQPLRSVRRSPGAGRAVAAARGPSQPVQSAAGAAAGHSRTRAGRAPIIPEFPADDPLLGIRGKEPSLDDLFGLKSVGRCSDLLAPDSPLGKPALGSSPASGGVVDPLEMFSSVGQAGSAAADRSGQRLGALHAVHAAAGEARGRGQASGAGDAVDSAAERTRRPAAERAAAPIAQRRARRHRPRRRPSRRAWRLPGSQEQVLLRAFLQGAGIPGSPSAKSLTPDTMEAIGQLLREAVQGTLDLLRARGLTKSEMRADVTMIMAQDNNPLKFSPSVEAALSHLLAPQMHGFMPPLRAMKDAYDDLRAHQLGFLAGMRAALEEVLARFSPQELGKRLTDQSFLDDLLPMNRKAKLWDQFVERYAAISSEAREDFNAAFGKAFRRAYEAQVKSLRAGPK